MSWAMATAVGVGALRGLAAARLENMKAGNRAIEVVRIRITGAGRDALAGED